MKSAKSTISIVVKYLDNYKISNNDKKCNLQYTDIYIYISNEYFNIRISHVF